MARAAGLLQDPRRRLDSGLDVLRGSSARGYPVEVGDAAGAVLHERGRFERGRPATQEPLADEIGGEVAGSADECLAEESEKEVEHGVDLQ
ncbi:hypothetical protein [Kitasatospora sp. NPDC058478]|uniref:hypothetical protein n=1 Tax=unclassified Kitasatospora TaxID=2633591 RepID=UPI003653EFBC